MFVDPDNRPEHHHHQQPQNNHHLQDRLKHTTSHPHKNPECFHFRPLNRYLTNTQTQQTLQSHPLNPYLAKQPRPKRKMCCLIPTIFSWFVDDSPYGQYQTEKAKQYDASRPTHNPPGGDWFPENRKDTARSSEQSLPPTLISPLGCRTPADPGEGSSNGNSRGGSGYTTAIATRAPSPTDDLEIETIPFPKQLTPPLQPLPEQQVPEEQQPKPFNAPMRFLRHKDGGKKANGKGKGRAALGDNDNTTGQDVETADAVTDILKSDQ
ncbi:MAG: hypothetical protein M1832_000181 [Thelocarpon impressellum]|nr:MAG: hypothetical protein M1832_000181 [Thelocarpon impressellum]